MSQKFRVGFVGAGYVSNHHIRAVKDLDFTEVVGICDSDAAKAKLTAEKTRIADTRAWRRCGPRSRT